jgi:hypothetical protein
MIPFNAAFETMMLTICDGPVPKPWPAATNYMKPSGLTQEQQDVVMVAAVKYTLAVRDAVKAWSLIRKTAPAPDRMARINAVSQQLDQKLEALRQSVETELGPDGYRQLVTFVETTVKSTMAH